MSARGLVRRFRVVFIAVAVAVAGGCGGSGAGVPKNLPAATPSTTVGPGDVFTVTVVGEKELPTEYRVQPDGTIDFPYVKRVKVDGLEPQQIVDVLRSKLVEAKVLTDPQISLIVRQYNSKKVSIIGQVTKPGSLSWAEGMKIVDAISQAGWFTPIADSGHVVLTRLAGGGKTVTVTISVDAITDGKQQDIPLQAGDTIKVEARVF
jgi:protein involved in polysaccharide export with SLBB domain